MEYDAPLVSVVFSDLENQHFRSLVSENILECAAIDRDVLHNRHPLVVSQLSRPRHNPSPRGRIRRSRHILRPDRIGGRTAASQMHETNQAMVTICGSNGNTQYQSSTLLVSGKLRSPRGSPVIAIPRGKPHFLVNANLKNIFLSIFLN